jgi:hypothetical protein
MNLTIFRVAVLVVLAAIAGEGAYIAFQLNSIAGSTPASYDQVEDIFRAIADTNTELTCIASRVGPPPSPQDTPARLQRPSSNDPCNGL